MDGPHVPKINQFPPSITLGIVPPPDPANVKNVLILLHGIGDSEVPFTKLAGSLNLQGTVGISLRGPHILPAFFCAGVVPGFRWSDDLLYSEATGEIDMDSGFSSAVSIIDQVVRVLTQDCGFCQQNICFFAYGQGALAGFGYISRAEREDKSSNMGFGGFIAIGGGLPGEQLTWQPVTPQDRLKTPILLCGSSQGTHVTATVVQSVRQRFAQVEYVRWSKEEDGMPRNRDEMYPIMRFFAQHLA